MQDSGPATSGKTFQNLILRTSIQTRNIHSCLAPDTNTCEPHLDKRSMRVGSYLKPCRVLGLSLGFSFEMIETGSSFAGSMELTRPDTEMTSQPKNSDSLRMHPQKCFMTERKAHGT